MLTTLAFSDFWDGVWWIISFAIAVIVIFVVIWAFIDNFARRDHSGWAKAAWAVVIIFLPILYLIARPAEPGV